MIYVDDMLRPARVGRISAHWSHLFTDQEHQAELHAFAERLGLRRDWFQGERWQDTHPWRCHYDVTSRVRTRAIRMGAQRISYPSGVAALIDRRRALADGLIPREPCGLLRDHHPHWWQLLVDDHRSVPRDAIDRWCTGEATRPGTRAVRVLSALCL